MLAKRKIVQPQAINGGCCDTGCANPYDLAIVPLSVTLTDSNQHTFKIVTNTFPGRIVGMRVLNSPGEVDVLAITQPQQIAGATYIGSGNTTIVGSSAGTADFLPTAVDASTWSTTECLCAVDLGCVTNTIGPTITVSKSTAATFNPSVHAFVDAGATNVAVRINFYICYDDGVLKNPSALCGTGATIQ